MGTAKMMNHLHDPSVAAEMRARVARLQPGAPAHKKLVLRDESPLKRNTPTAPTLLVKDERDFDRERRRLDALIQRFCDGREAGCTTHPHTFFGHMSPREWAVLQYKHLDHHLHQFGA